MEALFRNWSRYVSLLASAFRIRHDRVLSSTRYCNGRSGFDTTPSLLLLQWLFLYNQSGRKLSLKRCRAAAFQMYPISVYRLGLRIVRKIFFSFLLLCFGTFLRSSSLHPPLTSRPTTHLILFSALPVTGAYCLPYLTFSETIKEKKKNWIFLEASLYYWNSTCSRKIGWNTNVHNNNIIIIINNSFKALFFNQS